jgi:hypothetical protein
VKYSDYKQFGTTTEILYNGTEISNTPDDKKPEEKKPDAPK